MANQLKGEIEVSLGGKKLLLRPTFEGLLEIEDKAGCGISKILATFAKKEWTLRHVAAVICGGLHHYVDPKTNMPRYPLEVVGPAIMKQGMMHFLSPAVILLSKAVNPEYEEGEEPKKEEAGSSE